MKLSIRYDRDPSKRVPHQQAFQSDDDTKFLHLSGGYGSGKTHSLIMKSFKLSYLNRPFPGGLVCPTYTDYSTDVLPMMEELLERNRVKYHYHQTKKYFQFPWSKGPLYVKTADKKIRGPNWAYALINELTLMPLDRYREIISRVRIKGARCPQVASSGTPEGIASEFYDVFVDRPWKRSRVIYGDTRDNAFNLGDDYVQTLTDSFDSKMLDAYMKGLWVNMSGNRFYYAYDPMKNEDRSIVREHGEPVLISMDFNVDPMVATLWVDRQWYIAAFGEIVCEGTDTTNKMCQAMKAQGYYPDQVIIYPDPAGQQRSTKGLPDIEILKLNGYKNIVHRSVAPPMRQRQLNMNNLLEKRIIRLNPDKATMLRKDFLGVEQDKGTLEKVKKNPRMTHASDGADYLFDIRHPLSGKRAKTEVGRLR